MRFEFAQSGRCLQRQLVGIRALEFADAAVVNNHRRQFVVVREFHQYVFSCRRLAFWCLANNGQFLLFEQDLLQLLWRAQVKRPTSQFMCFGLEFGHLFREFAALSLQHLAVDEHAGLFHVQQHRNERLLDFFVDLFEWRYVA